MLIYHIYDVDDENDYIRIRYAEYFWRMTLC